METDPARHSQRLESNPSLTPESPHGEAVVTNDMTGPSVSDLTLSALSLGGVPVTYDFDEDRTYLGHKAGLLAKFMENRQALGAGRDRVWPMGYFYNTSTYFLRAFAIYDVIKSYIALLLSPVTDKELGVKLITTHDPLKRYRAGQFWRLIKNRAPRIIHSKPGKRHRWVVRPPSSKEWDKMDDVFGFDVRGTSPTHIIRQAKRLRRKQIAAVRQEHGLKAPKTTIVISQHSPRMAREVGEKTYKMAEDMFAIWPPVELPKVPPTVRRQSTVSAGMSDAAKSNINDAQVLRSYGPKLPGGPDADPCDTASDRPSLPFLFAGFYEEARFGSLCQMREVWGDDASVEPDASASPHTKIPAQGRDVETYKWTEKPP